MYWLLEHIYDIGIGNRLKGSKVLFKYFYPQNTFINTEGVIKMKRNN